MVSNETQRVTCMTEHLTTFGGIVTIPTSAEELLDELAVVRRELVVSQEEVKFTSQALAESCLACSPGQFGKTTKSALCSKCPLGEFSQAGKTSCTRCRAGKFPTVERSHCSRCRKGTLPPPRGSLVIGGRWVRGNGCLVCNVKTGVPKPYGCPTCDVGQFQGPEVGVCFRCPVGKFQAYKDANYCTVCPGGQTTATSGASTCTCAARVCKMTRWAPWSQCFKGLKYRQRLVRSPPNACAPACPPTLASTPCAYAVDTAAPTAQEAHPGLPGRRSSLVGGLAIPQWFASTSKLTWNDASALCASKFMVLATREELCPHGRPFSGALDAHGKGGWLPVLDGGNGEYMYYGQAWDGSHDGIFLKACTMHHEYSWMGVVGGGMLRDHAGLPTWSFNHGAPHSSTW